MRMYPHAEPHAKAKVIGTARSRQSFKSNNIATNSHRITAASEDARRNRQDCATNAPICTTPRIINKTPHTKMGAITINTPAGDGGFVLMSISQIPHNNAKQPPCNSAISKSATKRIL